MGCWGQWLTTDSIHSRQGTELMPLQIERSPHLQCVSPCSTLLSVIDYKMQTCYCWLKMLNFDTWQQPLEMSTLPRLITSTYRTSTATRLHATATGISSTCCNPAQRIRGKNPGLRKQFSFSSMTKTCSTLKMLGIAVTMSMYVVVTLFCRCNSSMAAR